MKMSPRNLKKLRNILDKKMGGPKRIPSILVKTLVDEVDDLLLKELSYLFGFEVTPLHTDFVKFFKTLNLLRKAERREALNHTVEDVEKELNEFVDETRVYF